MKSILSFEVRKEVLARLESLQGDEMAQWGKMSCPQMVCHLGDQMKVMKKEIPTRDISSIVTRTLVRWLVLAGFPPPKGKIRTFKEIDQARGKGTCPGNFEENKKEVMNLIEEFVLLPEDYPFARHAAFGDVGKNEWAKLIWVHLDHHLKQFSR